MKEKLRKVKVCIYCEQWGSGGIESFLLNVLEHMHKEDFIIDIVVSRIESDLYCQRIKDLNIKLIQLSGNIRSIIKNHHQFRRLLKSNGYDVIYINIFQALSFLYAYDAKKEGVMRRIVHSHNKGLRAGALKVIKLQIHNLSKILFARFATECWACSRSAAEFMFPKNMPYKVLPNGIDLQRFLFNENGRYLQREYLNLQGQFVIGNVGRLCYQKNQAFLLKILADLISKRKDVVLLLVGEGEDQEKLVQLAETLKIKNKVIFYGSTNSVESLFWAMDVFLFPSHFEGLGIAAVEAQAAGLPVLCSNHVPKEADVTGTVEFLPINQGVEIWANKLMLNYERANRLADIKAAGYDIKDVADTIRRLWLAQ